MFDYFLQSIYIIIAQICDFVNYVSAFLRIRSLFGIFVYGVV